ncbi:hypothetical protein GCM10008966_30480 [Rhodovulum strictum]
MMVKALSVDLRARVLKAVAEGASHRAVAERFGVSAASVSRWRALARSKGELRPGNIVVMDNLSSHKPCIQPMTSGSDSCAERPRESCDDMASSPLPRGCL